MEISATIGFITKEYEMKGNNRRLVRTRRRQPDFVRKAGPMDTSDRLRERQRDREFRDEVQRALEDRA